MCGIAGIVRFDGQNADERDLKKLGDAIKHRGPDDSGTFLFEGVGMVHERLSIIDLKTGGQPIFNEDGTLAIIFNGEIYNFPELRSELLGSAISFTRTRILKSSFTPMSSTASTA